MKRIVFGCFILTLLGSVSLWALRDPVDGRYYNRDKNHRAVQNRFGQCQGWDKDGPLEAKAETKVNVEYPTEWPPNWRWGVETSANATVKGTGPDSSYNGYWLVDAYDPNDRSDWDGKYWDGKVDEDASASDFDWWEDENVQCAPVVAYILSSLDANASVSGGGTWGSGSSGSSGPAAESNYAIADGNW